MVQPLRERRRPNVPALKGRVTAAAAALVVIAASSSNRPLPASASLRLRLLLLRLRLRLLLAMLRIFRLACPPTCFSGSARSSARRRASSSSSAANFGQQPALRFVQYGWEQAELRVGDGRPNGARREAREDLQELPKVRDRREGHARF